MLLVALSSRNPDCERIVKLGDPAIKIAEIADKLEVDIIHNENKRHRGECRPGNW